MSYLQQKPDWEPNINVGLVEPQDTLMLISDAKKSASKSQRFTAPDRWSEVVSLAFHTTFETHAHLLSMHEHQLLDEKAMEIKAKKMGEDLRSRTFIKAMVKNVAKSEDEWASNKPPSPTLPCKFLSPSPSPVKRMVSKVPERERVSSTPPALSSRRRVKEVVPTLERHKRDLRPTSLKVTDIYIGTSTPWISSLRVHDPGAPPSSASSAVPSPNRLAVIMASAASRLLGPVQKRSDVLSSSPSKDPPSTSKPGAGTDKGSSSGFDGSEVVRSACSEPELWPTLGLRPSACDRPNPTPFTPNTNYSASNTSSSSVAEEAKLYPPNVNLPPIRSALSSCSTAGTSVPSPGQDSSVVLGPLFKKELRSISAAITNKDLSSSSAPDSPLRSRSGSGIRRLDQSQCVSLHNTVDFHEQDFQNSSSALKNESMDIEVAREFKPNDATLQDCSSSNTSLSLTLMSTNDSVMASQPLHSQSDLVGMDQEILPPTPTTLFGALPETKGGAKTSYVDSKSNAHPNSAESAVEGSNTISQSECWAMEPSSPVDPSPPLTIHPKTHVLATQHQSSLGLSNNPARDEQYGLPFLEVSNSLLVSVDVLIQHDGVVLDETTGKASAINKEGDASVGAGRRARIEKQKAALNQTYRLSHDEMQLSWSAGKQDASSQEMSVLDRNAPGPGVRNPNLQSRGSSRKLDNASLGLHSSSAAVLPSPPPVATSPFSRLSQSSGGSSTSSASLSSFRRASLAVLASSHSSSPLGRARTPISSSVSATSQLQSTHLGLIVNSYSTSKLGSYSTCEGEFGGLGIGNSNVINSGSKNMMPVNSRDVIGTGGVKSRSAMPDSPSRKAGLELTSLSAVNVGGGNNVGIGKYMNKLQ